MTTAESGLLIESTTDRREAFQGAGFVVNSIAIERNRLWKLDFEVPKKYGIRHTLGENGGPGGLFFTMRTIPLILDIVRDMEELCPEAYFINFSNPESRIILALGPAQHDPLHRPVPRDFHGPARCGPHHGSARRAGRCVGRRAQPLPMADGNPRPPDRRGPLPAAARDKKAATTRPSCPSPAACSAPLANGSPARTTTWANMWHMAGKAVRKATTLMPMKRAAKTCARPSTPSTPADQSRAEYSGSFRRARGGRHHRYPAQQKDPASKPGWSTTRAPSPTCLLTWPLKCR